VPIVQIYIGCFYEHRFILL